MESYIVSARKYRPSTFESVIGQKALTTTLKNAILTQKLAHAYLFCGPRGVGKTTCARIFAKTINCLHLTPEGEACNECESCRAFNEQRSYNIHELDAASNNSADNIRALIEQVRIPPQIGKYKVYIIDEVHMLSSAASNAFLKTLEEPPHHAVFILATTEKHKIIPTILSRCQTYDFNRIGVNDIITHLQNVAQKENIQTEQEALNIIAQKADGGMRDALSIFDQLVSFTQGNVTYQQAINSLNVLDYEFYFKMTDILLQNKVSDAILLLNEILNKGFDGNHFINGLGSHFRDLLVSRDSATLPLLEVADNVKQRYHEQAMRCEPKTLYRAMKLCSDCDLNYRISKNKRLLVEITLIQLAQLTTEDESPGCGQCPTTNNTLKPVFKQEQTKQTAVQTQKQVSEISENATKGTVYPTEQKQGTSENTKKIPTVDIKSIGISIKHAPAAGKPTEKAISPTLPDDSTKKELKEDYIFNEKDLRHYWLEFANLLPAENAANAGRMKTIAPHLINDTTFEIVVDNEFVEKNMTDMIPQIQEHLRKQLHNSKITMTVRVSKPQEVVKAYNKAEQYQMMSKKNPNLKRLCEELDLELS